MKKDKILITLLLVFTAQWPPVHAEISGSGSPNSGCLGQISGTFWHDLNTDGIADAAEPVLADVAMYLVYDDGGSSITAVTNAAGHYQFNFLCDGEYLAVIDDATLPDGLLLAEAPHTGDTVDAGGWIVGVGDGQATTVNRGFRNCDLLVQASCTVGSLASELYRCEKPIDVLSLVWGGEQTIRVVAHAGKRDDPILADLDNIAQGDVVTVSGIAGGPDDVIWEIFEAGTDNKLGESKLRIACDDEEMDGPEDCGLPQGNGKDNKVEFINEWLLEGIVDDSGLLECTNSNVVAETCEAQSTWTDCELLDKVNWLTFAYTGGDCASSTNDQPDKFECSGQVDSSAPVSITTESGDVFVVQPGESFTVPTEGADTEFELSNAPGSEELRIHTSCSKPLTVGDTFGSLTLLALNGLGIGAQINYEYELDNRGVLPVIASPIEVPFRTMHQSSIAIEAQSMQHISGSAYVSSTTTSAVLAERSDGANAVCNGADFVGVIVTPALPCEISGSGLHFHDKELRIELGSGDDLNATIDWIELSWPTTASDKLKEIKLDGDKIFDQDRTGGVTVIEKADLMGELNKRSLPRSASKELKIVFDDEIDETSLDDFEVDIYFRQGCHLRIGN